MSRKYVFRVVIECATDDTRADLARVEEMLDLSMQELVYDDAFIVALNEKEAVSVTTILAK